MACGWNLDLLISNFHYIIIYLTQCKQNHIYRKNLLFKKKNWKLITAYSKNSFSIGKYHLHL